MMGNVSKVVAMVVVVVVAVSVNSANGKTHTVRDIFGWTNLGSDTDFYNLWAAFYEFNVNDTLLFKFKTGEHTVAEVSKEAYEKCDANNPMNVYTEGPVLNVTLSEPGSRFFICTIPGHCLEDERFAVNVSTTLKP